MRDLHLWLDQEGTELRREGGALIEGSLHDVVTERAWKRLVAALAEPPVYNLDLAIDEDDRVLDAAIEAEDDGSLHVSLREVTRYVGPLHELTMITQDLNDRSRDLAALESLAAALTSTIDVQRVAEVTAVAIENYLDADAVVVRFDGIPGDNAAGRGALPPDGPSGEQSMATTHLRLGTIRWWGGLVLSPARLRLISLMASRAAAVAETALLFSAAQEQAHRDHLTGLLNRGGAIGFLDALHAPALLISLDIDHFKRVNDTFGHATGDRVLRDVAAVLSDVSRPGDIVARWGGEEFLLAWPRVRDTEGALERVRALVRAMPERVKAGDEGVTISAGVAELGSEGWQVDVERSDRALYAAKRAGRNRVEVYAP